MAKSTESTNNPNGIIQNPTTGKNPNMPNRISNSPIASRTRRLRGRLMDLLPRRILEDTGTGSASIGVGEPYHGIGDHPSPRNANEVLHDLSARRIGKASWLLL
jgi:hypothetical protein